jgi:hypothetical protein
MGLFPEEVGVLVGITICEKSPVEAPVAMAADKRYEVAPLCHWVLAIAEFARLLRCIGKVCF